MTNAEFVGSIPENYDRYLGPLLFEPYARDLAERLPSLTQGSVLELACGTGIVTRQLRDRLPSTVHLIATDLNQAMIDFARPKFKSDEPLEWTTADATSLHFPDNSFDAVVCQFGLMFFPDKQTALNECLRVLVPGGTLLANVWDAIEHNEIASIASTAVRRCFPDNPPTFYSVPYGFYDGELIKRLLQDSGFTDVELREVALPGVSPSARYAAKGFIEGTPVSLEILQRSPSGVEAVENAVADAIARHFGPADVRSRTRALVLQAKKPRSA